MHKTRRFYIFWLIFGLFQLFAIAGGGKPPSSEGFFSSEIAEAAGTVAPSVSRVTRVSNSFFDRPVKGEVVLTQNQSTLVQDESPVVWDVTPKTDPPLPAEAQAAFYVHTGCAKFQNDDQLSVCFQMPGDVSSMAIDSKETRAQGVIDYISDQADCDLPVQDLTLKNYQIETSSLELVYEAKAAPNETNAACAGNAYQIKIDFSPN